MIDDYDDDTHFCLICHATIIGLNNYVDHRKLKCGKLATAEDIQKSDLQLLPYEEPSSLKANDFFSQLGRKTISKTSAISQASANKEPEPSKSGKNAWIGGHQSKELGAGDNQTKLNQAVDNLSRNSTIKKDEPPVIGVYNDSNDDSEDFDYDDDDSEDFDYDDDDYSF